MKVSILLFLIVTVKVTVLGSLSLGFGLIGSRWLFGVSFD